MGTTFTPKTTREWEKRWKVEMPTQMDNTLEIGLREEDLKRLECLYLTSRLPRKGRITKIILGQPSTTQADLFDYFVRCAVDRLNVTIESKGDVFPTVEGGIPSPLERMEQLERQNAELRARMQTYMPHKRFFGTALAFQFFFSGALLLQFLTGADLISPLVAITGMGVGAAVMALSFLKELEIRATKRKQST